MFTRDAKRIMDEGRELKEAYRGEVDLEQPLAERPKGRANRLRAFLYTFPFLMILWIIFSGKFDSFHLSLGVISCALVAYFSGEFLVGSNPSFKHGNRVFWRFMAYIPWLMWEIIKANVHVMRLTLHPNALELMEPHLIRFRSDLKSDIAKVTFANSITLTPGTITVSVDTNGEFVVHAIDLPSGEALPGEMEKQIAKVFEVE